MSHSNVIGGSGSASAVTGPGPGAGTSTDNAVARWDGTTGNAIQNSGVIVDDSNNITVPSLTASRAVVTDGSKVLASSVTTATELAFVNGVTSAIQTQINSKGDVSGPASSVDTRLALFDGTTGKLLKQSANITAAGNNLSLNDGRLYLQGNNNIVRSGAGALFDLELVTTVSTDGFRILFDAVPTYFFLENGMTIGVSGGTDSHTVNGSLTTSVNTIIGGGATAGQLKFLEPSGSGTNFTAFKAQAQASDITYTLPAADAAGALTSNGSGALSWAGYASSTLADGKIYVGNGSNVATAVTPSGDVTTTNAGVFTVAKIQSTTVSGTTGTGNVVFSASPTLTGTAVLASATISGSLKDGNYHIEPGITADGNSSTAITIDFSVNSIQTVTMTGNCTFTFSNPQTGGIYILQLLEDATGNRVATWPATVKFFGTSITQLSPASKMDQFQFVWDGTNYWATAAMNG